MKVKADQSINATQVFNSLLNKSRENCQQRLKSGEKVIPIILKALAPSHSTLAIS